MVAITSVASDNTNLVTGRVAPNAAPDTGSAGMSFDDFIDMVNPLQHIPVLSSIYRAVTGDTINPVSRIAGDTLYGGVFGLASAGISMAGAIGDEIVAANNDGKSASETIVAALFGSDAPQPATPETQIADASTAPALQSSILLQTPMRQSPLVAMPVLAASTPAADQTPAPAQMAAASDNQESDSTATPATKGMPLDRSKMPYGGVMDTAMMQNAQQNQTLALALAGSQNNLQAQRAIRSNRFATAATAAAPALAPTLPTAAATPDVPVEPQTKAAMQSLLQELQAQKGVQSYRNAAQSLPLPGTSIYNFTN